MPFARNLKVAGSFPAQSVTTYLMVARLSLTSRECSFTRFMTSFFHQTTCPCHAKGIPNPGRKSRATVPLLGVQEMTLPRGRPGGMPFRLFFMASALLPADRSVRSRDIIPLNAMSHRFLLVGTGTVYLVPALTILYFSAPTSWHCNH